MTPNHSRDLLFERRPVLSPTPLLLQKPLFSTTLQGTHKDKRHGYWLQNAVLASYFYYKELLAVG